MKEILYVLSLCWQCQYSDFYKNWEPYNLMLSFNCKKNYQKLKFNDCEGFKNIMTEQQEKIIAFTVRPGCENAIDTGDADVYVVPDQPMSVKSFHCSKELAEWLVRYNVGAEIARVPSGENIDAIVDVINAEVVGDITDGSE